MNIRDSRVVLTGAASGIGLALLRELYGQGCQIVAADYNEPNLLDAVRPYPTQVHSFLCDIAVNEEVDQLFDFAVKTMGSIDLFIANAGFAYYEKMAGADWQHAERIFRVNTLSPVYSLLKMKEMPHEKPWKVVMVSSAMALWAVPGYSLYGATKAAVQRFSEGYRFEDPGRNLAVVYPIATRTGFFAHAGEHIPVAFPVMRPETVARRILSGIRRDHRKIHPSRLFRMMYNVNRLLPFIRPVYQRMENRKFRKWLGANPS